MNVWKLEKCHSTRMAMKSWNACIQYWMGVYVYKRFPYKSLRTLATFTLSAAWHGWSAGYYICICQIPLFLMSEDIGMKFYQQSKENSLVSTTSCIDLKFLPIISIHGSYNFRPEKDGSCSCGMRKQPAWHI